jgi:hypothetical protein
MTPEGRIKKIVNKGLKLLQAKYPGKLWVRMPVTRGMGKPWLDYHICADGQTISIETKSNAKYVLTPMQRQTQRELQEAGAFVFVVFDHSTADHALSCIEGTLCLKS